MIASVVSASSGALTLTFSGDTSTALANQVLQSITYRNDSAATGSTVNLTISANDGQLSSASQSVKVAINTAPAVDSSIAGSYQLPTATSETGYSTTLPSGLFSDADGDSLTWSVSGLPSGLSFDAATRTISGSTTQTGNLEVTVTVTDDAGASASIKLTLSVEQIANRAPVENPAAASSLAAVVVGTSGYSTTLDASMFSDPDSLYSGSSLTWSIVGDLPAGLSFDAATHTLSGTPSATGDYSLTVRVTDEHGATAEHSLSLRVISQAEADNSAPVLSAAASDLTYSSDGVLSGYSYYVNSVSESSDGSLLVIAGSTSTSVVGGASSQGSNFLSVYSRDTRTGALTLIQTFVQGTVDDGNAANGIEVDGLNAITSVTFSKDGKHVYVAGYGSTGSASSYGILAFSVDADGGLALTGRTADVAQKVVDVAMSSDGDVLIALSTTTIYTYTIGDDGSLTLKQSLVPLYTLGFNAVAKDLSVDANGTVYAISNGRMAIYTYDSTSNELSYRGTVQSSSGIVYRQYAGKDANGNDVFNTITLSSSTGFALTYAMDAGGDGNVYVATFNNFTVYAFHYDASTNSIVLTQSVETSSPANYPTSVAVSEDGSMVYIGYGFSSVINAYSIGTNGALTLEQSISTGLNHVYRITVTADNHLLVGNNNSNGGSTGLGLISPASEIQGSYTEGSSIAPAAGISVADADYDALNGGAGNYKGATLTLVRDGGANSSDSYGFSAGDGLTLENGQILQNGAVIATFVSAGGQLTVSFTADVSTATANAVLQRITYQNTSKTPDSQIRLNLGVQDQYASGTDTLTLVLAVTAINDAPEVQTSSGSQDYDAGQSAVKLFSDSVVDTVESGQLISELTFSISGLHDGSSETLTLDGTAIALVAGSGTTTHGYTYQVSVSSDGVASLTLSSASGISGAVAASLLDGAAYANSDRATATSGTRSISLTAVKDNGGTANGGSDTASLNLTAQVDVSVGQSPSLGNATGALGYDELVNLLAEDGYSNLLEGIQDLASVGDKVYVVRTGTVYDPNTYQDVAVSTLYVLQRGSDGSLSLLQSVDASAESGLTGASQVRVSDDGAYVYVLGDAGVTLFAVDAQSGELSTVGSVGSDLLADNGLIRDVLVHDGVIYISADDSLSVYTTAADGSLQLLGRYSDAGDSGVQLDGAGSLALSADGQFLFVATSGGSTLASVFRVGSDGSLSFVMAAQGSDPAASEQYYYASSLSLSPDGSTLYVADNDGSAQHLYTFSVSAEGQLSAVTSVELSESAKAVLVSSDGALLVVVGDSGLDLYSRAADGTLSYLQRIDSFADGSDYGLAIGSIRNAHLSADGSQLYLAGTFDWTDGLLVLDLEGQHNTYTEDASAVAILPGGTLSDPQLDALADGAGNYQGASIVIVRDGGASGDDHFSLVQSDGLSLVDGQVLLDGAVIGSFAESNGQLTLTFTAAVTHAQAQSVLQHIAYSNASNDPTANGDSLKLAVTLNDGDGHSTQLLASVGLVGVNDAPLLDTTALQPTYHAEDEAVHLFEGTQVDTVEAGQNIWQVVVSVQPVGSGESLGVEGGRISLDSATSGVQTTGTGLQYMVTIKDGVATVTLYINSTTSRAESLIDSLTYSNSGSDLSGSRSIQVQVVEYADENTKSLLSQTAVVTLAAASAANTAPTLSGAGETDYTEQAAPVAIAPSAEVHDAQMDAFNGGQGNYNGAVLTITLGSGTSASDSLGFSAGNGLSLVNGELLKDGSVIAQVSVANGVMTLRFSDAAGVIPTQADVQNALRQVTYANSSDVPVAQVAVSITLADQRGLVSQSLDSVIEITPVNDAPVLSSDPLLSLGELQHVQSLDDLANASSVTVSADGHYVYAADSSGQLALFSRDSQTGALTLVGTWTVDGLSGVKQLLLSADNGSLYALNSDGNAIVRFSVAADGTLQYQQTLVDDYAVTGSNLYDIQALALSADGTHLYLINSYGGQMAWFTRDTSSG
ncbi:MAG: Serine-rich adhesin for platelets [Pseudomonas citronellolis]|nr:MAG: Serine-rich adhesin for platelets [Pseudomonas citronellolis]